MHKYRYTKFNGKVECTFLREHPIQVGDTIRVAEEGIRFHIAAVHAPSGGFLTAEGSSVVEVHTSADQSAKADDGKPNWDLLMSAKGCAAALAGVVRVLSFAVRSKDKGGKGYAPHSWRGVEVSRYKSALYRHLSALEQGEEVDPESGESHWAHVATNALFLSELTKK